ncbi:hypothetical protein JNM05_13790 [bacterium]|nr:hypothetical protein [bacterium]
MKFMILLTISVLMFSCTRSLTLDTHDTDSVEKFLSKAHELEAMIYVHPNIQYLAKVIAFNDSIVYLENVKDGTKYNLPVEKVRIIFLKDPSQSWIDGATLGAITLGTLGAVLYGKYDNDSFFSMTKREPIQGALYFGIAGGLGGSLLGGSHWKRI